MKQISENDRSYLAEHVRVTRITRSCNGWNTFVQRVEHVRVTSGTRSCNGKSEPSFYIKYRECYIKLISIIVI